MCKMLMTWEAELGSAGSCRWSRPPPTKTLDFWLDPFPAGGPLHASLKLITGRNHSEKRWQEIRRKVLCAELDSNSRPSCHDSFCFEHHTNKSFRFRANKVKHWTVIYFSIGSFHQFIKADLAHLSTFLKKICCFDNQRVLKVFFRLIRAKYSSF